MLQNVFPETENYKITVVEASVTYRVIEVWDCTPHPSSGEQTEKLLLAVHVWKRCHKYSIFNDATWRQEELER